MGEVLREGDDERFESRWVMSLTGSQAQGWGNGGRHSYLFGLKTLN